MSDQFTAVYKSYEKLGGWLLFFFIFQWISIVVNGLTFFVGIFAGITAEAAGASGSGGNFTAFVSGFIQVCIAISYIVHIAKKPMFTASLAQVRVILRTMAILSVCGLVIILIFSMLFAFIPEYANSSLAANGPFIIFAVVFSFAWNMIWYRYFKRSNRVAVYYGLLQPEDLKSGIVNIPELEKKFEQEVADTFKTQNALSKDTAVSHDDLAINILDWKNKYAAVVYDMRFNRRLIKVVKGKYYYGTSSKDGYINNVPVKFYKVCGIIVLVCLIIMVLAGVMIALNP